MNITNILTVLFLFLGLSLNATSVEPELTLGADKTFTVDLADWSGLTTGITITDHNGFTLFSEKMSGTGKTFDLRNLEKGKYNVSLKNKLKIVNTAIEISKEQVEIMGREVVYRPLVNLNEDFFDLNVLTQGQSVSVVLYDTETKIFGKRYTDIKVVSDRFLLSQLPAGDYLISITKGSDNTMYKYTR